MRIAVCDDERKMIEAVAKLLDSYTLPNGQKIEYDTYESAVELLSVLEKRKYDALILDIVMPGFTGMDAAKDIRKTNESINIIFLTSSPEYAVESYRVRAFDYIMKPVKKEDLYAALDRIFSTAKVETESLCVETSKAIFNIPFEEIEYLEVNNRTLIFHMSDKTVREISGHLKEYEDKLLQRPEFIKVHRSFIVNMKRMKTLDSKDFIAITGATIPIARSLVKETKEKFLSYTIQSI